MNARQQHASPRIDQRRLRRNIRSRAQREIINCLAKIEPKMYKTRFQMSYSWSRIDHGADIEFQGELVTHEDLEQDFIGYIHFGRMHTSAIYPMLVEFSLDDQYAIFMFTPSPNGLILRRIGRMTEC